MFTLFMEQGSLWSDMCRLPEINSPELTESTLYGYLHQYLFSLERDVKLDVLEGINEKIRKRSKNPKLSNSSCAGVFMHASVTWCRSVIINLVAATPLHSSASALADTDMDNTQLLCVDLQTNEFWNSSFGDAKILADLETKWNTLLSKVKHVVIKKASEENRDTANSMLRSAYSFYRDSSSLVLTSGINLFCVSAHLVSTGHFQPSTDGVEIVDMSVPRKLLLWAYTLLHGHCPNISAAVKYCEENIKLKTKKTSASTSATCMLTAPTAHFAGGGCKDGLPSHGGSETGIATSVNAPSSALPRTNDEPATNAAAPSANDSQRILSTYQQLLHCNNNASAERRTFDLNDDADPEKC